MAKRLKGVVGAVAVALLLAACGGAPEYTMRQALIDVPTYEHAYWAYDVNSTTCVLGYLFNHVSAGEVKTIVRGGDFGDASPPVMSAAIQACGAIV